jgi:thiosulfate reductase/polysulfide reductase chain A
MTASRIDAVDPQYRYSVASGGIYQSIFETAISGQPYPIKAWFFSRTNPFQTAADLPLMTKAVETFELTVCNDIYMTDTAAYADYFLPSCTYLERGEDFAVNNGMSLYPTVNIRQPAVEIIGEAKPTWLIWKELAGYLGLGEHYRWKDMEERQFIQAGRDEALYNSIKEKGALSYGIPLYLREPESAREFVNLYPSAAANLSAQGDFSGFVRFGTASGKVELCPPALKEIAPDYVLPRFQNIKITDNEDDLIFIQGKVAVHTNGGTARVPWLAALMPDNPVWIHPDAAARINVKTGDMVELSNSLGTERARALVTKGVRPDVVFTYMAGYGAKTGEKTGSGVQCANLIKSRTNDVTAMLVHRAGVKISKVRG